jgi:AcrR family transcriptional regulator
MSAPDKPLRADAERNRRRILDAANDLFSERGLGVTLNDVAHHAGVGVGTVYRRYPDKEHLIDALFDERIGQLAAIVSAHLEDPDPWHGLVAAITELLELQERDAGFKELLLSSNHGYPGIVRMRDELAPITAQLIARAKAAGSLRPDVERQDFPLIQIMLGAIIDCSREVAPGLWRRYLDMLLQGMRAEPSAPAEFVTPVPSMEVMPQVMRAWRPPRRD